MEHQLYSECLVDIITYTRSFSSTKYVEVNPNTGRLSYKIGYEFYPKICDVPFSFPEKITKKKSKELLKKILRRCSSVLSKLLGRRIPQNHFDTMCCLIYDIGIKNFKECSFFKLYLKGEHVSCASKLFVWSYDKGVFKKHLDKRRKLEYQIFTTNRYDIDKKVIHEYIT